MYSHGIPNPFEDEPLSHEEATSFMIVYRAAQELHEILDHQPMMNASGRVIFDRCYRELRRTVEAYVGNNHVLSYAPVLGTPFAKKECK